MNIFCKSGEKGNIKAAEPTKMPVRNNITPRLPTKRSRVGRKIDGKSFTKTAKPKAMPDDNASRPFFAGDTENTLDRFKPLPADCFARRRSAARKKKIPAPSTCPEAAISITGRGCHAYKTALETGNFIEERSLISMKQEIMSSVTSRSLIPKTFFPSRAPKAKIICAPGG